MLFATCQLDILTYFQGKNTKTTQNSVKNEQKTDLMRFPSMIGVGEEADVDDQNAALGGVPDEQEISLRVGHIPRLVVADTRRPLGLHERRKALLKLPKLAPTGIHARLTVYTRLGAASICRLLQLTQWRQNRAKFESSLRQMRADHFIIA
jgi:hypothetical protein